jgi:hypothetical protein
MERFYESEIEVMLCHVFDHHVRNAMTESTRLERIRHAYLKGSPQYTILTNQMRESWDGARTGKCGFLGSHDNFAFSTMYLVFGIDIIGFLFDVPWVPFVEIPRFDLSQYIRRVAILERSFKALRDGDEVPVKLPERDPNLWAAPDGRTKYSDELHGFFLRQGFKELRDFGEAAEDLDRYRQAAKRPTAECDAEPEAEVFIHLVHSYANHDADRLAYADYQRRYGPTRAAVQ